MADNSETERDNSESGRIRKVEHASITIHDSGRMCSRTCRRDSRANMSLS